MHVTVFILSCPDLMQDWHAIQYALQKIHFDKPNGFNWAARMENKILLICPFMVNILFSIFKWYDSLYTDDCRAC